MATLISAIQTGRNCIGYEYNEKFKELIYARIINEISNDENLVEFINE